MHPIALTGGIGSGKTTVLKIFESLGIQTICADSIVRNIMDRDMCILKKMQEHFGNSILEKKNTINRKKLRDIIFSNPTDRQWLESLIHPEVRKEIKKRVINSTSLYSIIEIPLLTKKTLKNYPYIEKVITVKACEETRMDRVIIRDEISNKKVQDIIHNQINDTERDIIANYILTNNTSIDNLKVEVKNLHDILLKEISI